MDQNKLPINKLLDLSGKVAIVTGGAMGIGLGIVERFTEAGCKVLIADLAEADSLKVCDLLGNKGCEVKFIKTDISNELDIKNAVEECIRQFGSLDILVNNAGIYPQIPLSKMTIEDFEKVLKVNLTGAFLFTKYAAENMKENGGGKVINITSIDALHPSMIGLAHYDASKHGLWGFTKNAALEYAKDKIWVNAIAPGGIATPGVSKGIDPSLNMNEVMEQFIAKIPMKRIGDPDDIGKVALFLASEMSSYMTGTQIVVDGGVLLS